MTVENSSDKSKIEDMVCKQNHKDIKILILDKQKWKDAVNQSKDYNLSSKQ